LTESAAYRRTCYRLSGLL